MAEVRVSIGQVKRDISELVNRVAYRAERIVLTSRGKPKAVLIGLEDYERLKEGTAEPDLERWHAWLEASDALTQEILARRSGEPVDVDAIWQQARADLEERDGQDFGR